MPQVYQLIVRGHLDPDWSEEFEGLSITHRCDGTSLLMGPLLDEGVLHAVLCKVHNLGLHLLSLTRLEPEEPPA